MGRKIPGKRHKGIKDPFEQQFRRNESLKLKINAPPLYPDEQNIPKSVLHIMKLRQDVKKKTFKCRKKKKNKGKNMLINTQCMAQKDIKLPGMTRPDKPAPEFIQRPGESNNNFLYRIEVTCQEVLKENSFEDKFGVDVHRDPDTGQVVSVTKKIKDESNNLVKKLKKKEHNKNKTKITKSEKRKQKLLAKKQSKLQIEEDGFDQFRDVVKFGEVVHQPPMLEIPLRMKAKIKSQNRGVGKKDLLLKL